MPWWIPWLALFNKRIPRKWQKAPILDTQYPNAGIKIFFQNFSRVTLICFIDPQLQMIFQTKLMSCVLRYSNTDKLTNKLINRQRRLSNRINAMSKMWCLFCKRILCYILRHIFSVNNHLNLNRGNAIKYELIFILYYGYLFFDIWKTRLFTPLTYKIQSPGNLTKGNSQKAMKACWQTKI